MIDNQQLTVLVIKAIIITASTVDCGYICTLTRLINNSFIAIFFIKLQCNNDDLHYYSITYASLSMQKTIVIKPLFEIYLKQNKQQ